MLFRSYQLQVSIFGRNVPLFLVAMGVPGGGFLPRREARDGLRGGRSNGVPGGSTRVTFYLLYLEKNRVFKAGLRPIEYISMG